MKQLSLKLFFNFSLNNAKPGAPPWNDLLSKLDKLCHSQQQWFTALVNVTLPPLSTQRAYLICYHALLLQEGGMRRVSLFPHNCNATGSSHLHQTTGEIQHETQSLHSVCMLLLHSNTEWGRKIDRERWFSDKIINLKIILHPVHTDGKNISNNTDWWFSTCHFIL